MEDKDIVKDWDMLQADELFFPRNEKEELIPKRVHIKEIEKDILITPMPRGEWVEMMSKSKDGETSEDQDALILEKHLIEPKVTAEQLTKSGKHFLIATIVSKILDYSSLTVDKSKKKV